MALVNLGILNLYFKADLEAAEGYLLQALTIAATVPVYIHLGTIYLHQNELHDAMRCAHLAHAMDIKCKEAIYLMALIQHKQGWVGEAHELLSNSDPDSFAILAAFYKEQKMYDKSLEYYVKAYNSNRDQAHIVDGLIDLFVEMQQFEQASQLLLAHLQEYPMNRLKESLFKNDEVALSQMMKQNSESSSFGYINAHASLQACYHLVLSKWEQGQYPAALNVLLSYHNLSMYLLVCNLRISTQMVSRQHGRVISCKVYAFVLDNFFINERTIDSICCAKKMARFGVQQA